MVQDIKLANKIIEKQEELIQSYETTVNLLKEAIDLRDKALKWQEDFLNTYGVGIAKLKAGFEKLFYRR